MKKLKNYGFKPPVISPEDYFLGSQKLGSKVINPLGDWRAFLPEFERQQKGIETNACVSFATLSALEILYKFLYKTEPNFSDRFLAKISGTIPEQGGNTPSKVSSALRHNGCVYETDYPFAEPLSEYYKEIPQEIKHKGLNWLKTNDFGYEWADSSQLKEALKRSPIGVAVSAWQANNKGEYIRFGASNHYVVLVAFDEQDRPVIYDSYESSLKTLEKGFKLEFPQLFKLSAKEVSGVWKQSGFFGKVWLFIRHFTLWR